MHTGFSVMALKQWKIIEEKLPKATINGRRFCTVYCTEHSKWNVRRVFHFICCKVDLCGPWGIHYRTRNGVLHFKVWKSQGRSFNEKGQETQELIIGQEDGESGTFKTGSKDASGEGHSSDAPVLRTGPCGLSSPLHRDFYKYMPKVHSVIKSNRVTMYLKLCLTSSEAMFMWSNQRLMLKWVWNQAKKIPWNTPLIFAPLPPIRVGGLELPLCPRYGWEGWISGHWLLPDSATMHLLSSALTAVFPTQHCRHSPTKPHFCLSPFFFLYAHICADCPALGAGSSAKDGRGQSGWHLLIMKNTGGFCRNIIIQGKLLLQFF